MDEQAVTSIPLAELSLEQLVQVSQGLGHQLDKIREQRAYLRAKIAERLAAGEREGDAERKAAAAAGGDATAPGASIEASASGA